MRGVVNEKRTCLRIAISGFLLAGLLSLLFMGCANLRVEGYDAFNSDFMSNGEPIQQPIYRDVTVRIFIVPSPAYMVRGQFNPARAGLFWTNGMHKEVYVLGRQKSGVIYINHAVLGHEIAHLLNELIPEIENPDAVSP